MTGPARANLFAALALLAAAALGGAAGYAIGRRPGPMKAKQVALLGVTRETLFDSLGLGPEQRAHIDSTLDAAEQQADRSIKNMMEMVLGLTQAAKADVRGVLTEPQRVRFDSLLSRAAPLLPRSPLPPARGTRRSP